MCVCVLTLYFLDEDARPMAAKYLTKWRPGFVESQSSEGKAGTLPAAVAA